MRVLGEGVIQFAVQRYTDVHGEVHSVVLEIPNCLYVPDCTFNLLSTSMLAELDISLYTGRKTNFLLIPGFSDMAIGASHGNLLQQYGRDGNPEFVLSMGAGMPMLPIFPVNDGEVWGTFSEHESVMYNKFDKGVQDVAVIERSVDADPDFFLSPEFRAHITYLTGVTAMNMMCTTGLYDDLNLSSVRCKSALEASHPRKLAANLKGNQKHNGEEIKRKAEYSGQVLYADLIGPFRPAGAGGVKYMMLVVDEMSRYVQPFPLKKKSDAARHLAEYISYVNADIAVGHDWVTDVKGKRVQKPRRVETLITDRGGEFLSDALAEFTTHHNVHRIYTGDGQHKSNGLQERANRTAEDKARAAFLGANMPPSLWTYAFIFSCFVMNLVPHSGILTDVANEYMHRKLKERSEAAVAEAAPEAEHIAAAVQSGDDLLDRPVVSDTDEDALSFGESESEQGEIISTPPDAPQPAPKVTKAGERRAFRKRMFSEGRRLCLANNPRRLVPYLAMFPSTTKEEFSKLLKSILPFGQPMYMYPRNSALRHMEARAVRCRYLGPAASTVMCTVMFKENGVLKVNVIRQRHVNAHDLRAYASRLHIAERAKLPDPELEKLTDDTVHFSLRNDHEMVLRGDAPSFIEDVDNISLSKREARRGHQTVFPQEGRALGQTVMQPLASERLPDKYLEELSDEELLNSPPPEDFGRGELIAEASHRRTPDVVSEVFYRQQSLGSKAADQGERLGSQVPLLHEHVQPFNADASRTLRWVELQAGSHGRALPPKVLARLVSEGANAPSSVGRVVHPGPYEPDKTASETPDSISVDDGRPNPQLGPSGGGNVQPPAMGQHRAQG